MSVCGEGMGMWVKAPQFPLKLDWQAVVSSPDVSAGIPRRSSMRAVSAVTAEPFPQPQILAS